MTVKFVYPPLEIRDPFEHGLWAVVRRAVAIGLGWNGVGFVARELPLRDVVIYGERMQTAPFEAFLTAVGHYGDAALGEALGIVLPEGSVTQH